MIAGTGLEKGERKMNELLVYIIIFLVVYIIDLATALLHRYMKPNNFKKIEANERFRRCLEQKGVLKGVGVYIILSSTETIILFIAIGIAANIIFDSTIILGLMFTFLLLAMIHILGTFTNLIALLKSDVIPKQPMINVNNMSQYLNKGMNSHNFKEVEKDEPTRDI